MGDSFTASLKDALRSNMRQYTMIAALLLIWAIFAVLTDGLFMSSRNLSNLFLQACTIGILTGGMLLVMVAGHIDLSVGSVCGTLGAVAAFLMSRQGLHPALAVAATLFLGMCVGAWHGFWVAYRGIPAFIATLASMIAFRGITLFVTNGATIGEFSGGFRAIGQGFIPRLFFHDAPFHDLTVAIFGVCLLLFIWSSLRKRKKRIANGFRVLPVSLEAVKIALVSGAIIWMCVILAGFNGIPYAIFILACIVSIFTVLTTRTPFGRHVYAIGGNIEAARLSGINIKRTLLGIFMLTGTLCAVAAIVFTARLNAATTSAGNLFELDTIAACIIGGTSTTGGVGTVFGAIIGALVMASLDNGMSLMNLPIMTQYMVKGAILLLAVWIDVSNRKK